MNQKYSRIEQLIERFMEGESSNREEQELYAFFSGEDIPEHLLTYRPIFAYFETGIQEESNHQKISFKTMQSPLWKKRGVWLSVAASLLIFILIGLYYYGRDNDYSLYEGSYIVRNGVKITDPRMVIPEVKKTILLAQQQEIAQETSYEQIMKEIRQQMEWVEQLENDIIPKELLEIISNQL